MKITSELGYKYVLKNKKRSMSIIFGIAIATVLITTVITLLSSYQQYLVSIIRNKKNWEIEFKNITYEDSLKIAEDENVKETAIIHSLGVSKEIFGKTLNTIKLEVKEFNETAFKNNNITVTEGRLPKKSNELIVSKAKKILRGSEDSFVKVEIGEKINLTLNGETKEYIVVGKTDFLDFDKASFTGSHQAGAITYLDTSKIENNAIVDVSILTKNIQKVYKTGDELIAKLNLNELQEQPQLSEKEILDNLLNEVSTDTNNFVSSVEYNKELLNYECVIEGNGLFAKVLLIIASLVIVILSIVSISMIKDSFNMAYWDRIKELGMLSSIGMNGKQRKNMIKIETRILGIIGIIIGLVLGLLLSYIGISIINNLIKHIDISQIFIIDNSIELSMKIPFVILVSIILIVWIIVKISSILPMIKINKISPIDAIKNTINIKITEKQVKPSKIIEKLFKEEGVIAYKNIKRDKSKYNTIVDSIVISLVLFLSINGIVGNIAKLIVSQKENDYDDYKIEISALESNGGIIETEKIEKIMKYLKDKNLVDDCYANMQPFYGTTVEISENKISNTAMKMINDGALYTNVKNDGNIEVELNNIWILGNAYNEILKRAGVKELKENEVIISSGITEKTKYGNKVNFTNLKVGDSYTVDIGKTIGNSAASQKTFTIAGIVDDFTPYINSKFNKEIVINQLISPENAISLIKEYGYVSFAEINIKTDAERAMKIDESIKDIKEIYGENGAIIGNNNLPNDFSNKKDSVDPSKDLTRITTNKVSLANEFNILQILLYSFVVVVAIISSVNIFNSIYANIMLRKKDFASLKSIGMSNKQMNKMMFFEGIFYGLKAMIFGISISIGILYLSYLFMIQTEIYLFNISWKSIFASIIVMYIVIFVSIICAKNELKNKNIVDEIREQNI